MCEPRLIVFDVDGTLIDSQKIILSSMKAAFEATGLRTPSDDAILSIVGLSLPEAMSGIDPELDDVTVLKLVEAYRANFVAKRAKGAGEGSVPLYAGAKECLTRLNADPLNVLGTATGKARRGLDVVIDVHGLQGLFVTLQTADRHPSKPHPSMLDAACAETGIPAERAVMIGDTSFDMEMGQAAGYATIGVAWGYHNLDRLAPNADLLVDRFQDIDAAIGSLLGE